MFAHIKTDILHFRTFFPNTNNDWRNRKYLILRTLFPLLIHEIRGEDEMLLREPGINRANPTYRGGVERTLNTCLGQRKFEHSAFSDRSLPSEIVIGRDIDFSFHHILRWGGVAIDRKLFTLSISLPLPPFIFLYTDLYLESNDGNLTYRFIYQQEENSALCYHSI